LGFHYHQYLHNKEKYKHQQDPVLIDLMDLIGLIEYCWLGIVVVGQSWWRGFAARYRSLRVSDFSHRQPIERHRKRLRDFSVKAWHWEEKDHWHSLAADSDWVRSRLVLYAVEVVMMLAETVAVWPVAVVDVDVAVAVAVVAVAMK